MAEDSLFASDNDGPCPLCEEEGDRPYMALRGIKPHRNVDKEESELQRDQINIDAVGKEIKEEDKIKGWVKKVFKPAEDDQGEAKKLATDESFVEMLKEDKERNDAGNVASSPLPQSVQRLDSSCPVDLVMVCEDSHCVYSSESEELMLCPSKSLTISQITSLSPTPTQNPLPLTLPPPVPSVLPIKMQGVVQTQATVAVPGPDAPCLGKRVCGSSPSVETKTVAPLGQLEVTLKPVYTTRRYTRFTNRPATLLPLPSVNSETSSQPLPSISNTSLLAPAPKKKTRTSYSTDQLEELERVFQDDHYPDADKRKEIAISVGVTPQRVMVWFQNRRAKWRKTSKVSAKKPPVNRTQASAPLQPPVPAPGHRTALFKGPTIAPLPPQTGNTLPPYSTFLAPCTSPTDMGTTCISQRCSGDYMPPLMQSPPPLRRASLPFFAAYNPPTHTLSVLLDTPEHSEPQPFNIHTDTGFNYDAVGLSSKYEALNSGPGNSSQSYLLTSYPQQSNSLLPQQPSTLLCSQNSNVLPQQPNTMLQQYSHMPYFTPSPYLTPSSSEGTATSCLPLNPSTSHSLLACSNGGHAYFQCQALQAYPWAGDLYSHSTQIPHAVLRPQFTSQSRESLYPNLATSQPYITPQKATCSGLAKPASPDPMLPSVKTESEDPGPSQSSRLSEPETIFHCDFSPIHF